MTDLSIVGQDDVSTPSDIACERLSGIGWRYPESAHVVVMASDQWIAAIQTARALVIDLRSCRRTVRGKARIAPPLRREPHRCVPPE